jgi:hypothetical protein
MNPRLLILGNSHLAALREAWAGAPARWPGLRPTFLGAHKDLLLQTQLKDGVLSPATDAARAAFRRLNGLEEVNLRDHDGIVICGCLVAASVAAGLWRDARWPGLPSLMAEPDLAGMRSTLISRGAALAGLAGALDQRLGLRLVRHLRAGTDLPVWLVSQPRANVAVLARPRPEVRAQVAAVQTGDGLALSDLFDAAAARAARQAGAVWLAQPWATRTAGIFTGGAFMQGATRLTPRIGAPQPEDDVTHANAAYGAMVLDQIAGALRDPAPGRAGH